MDVITGGELLVRTLADQGVAHVFSIIGGQMGTIYDAIGRRADMEVITPRSETSAPLMAAGYIASSGRPAVSMATVGAGVVYEMGGFLRAWEDFVPLVSIAPQVQSYKMKPHQENLQACDQDELFRPVTQFTAVCGQVKRIPQLVNRAFREAAGPAPGPVHLDVPVDVLFRHTTLTEKKKKRMAPRADRTRFFGRVPGDPAALDRAVKILSKAKAPLVVVGQGFGRQDRMHGLRPLLAELGAPVISTPAAFGTLPDNPGGFAGFLPRYLSTEGGREALKKADVILLIGRDQHIRRLDLNGAQGFVQVELDASAFVPAGRNMAHVQADPVSAVEVFLAGIPAKTRNAWASWTADFVSAGKACGKGLDPWKPLFDAVSQNMGPKDLIVADGSTASPAASCFLRHAGVRDLFVMDHESFGGAGLPFALGAVLANPEGQVYLFMDREALFHHVRELQPAAAMGLDFTLAVLDEETSRHNHADTAAVIRGFGLDARPFTGETNKNIPPAFIASVRKAPPA